jgi:oligopeptide transport system ATP-binding protein
MPADATAGIAAARSGPLLDVTDLQVHFPIARGYLRRRVVGTVRAVDGVSFIIGPGETLALVGESGSGKTTTGRAIIGLVRPTGGTIRFEGRAIDAASAPERRVLRRRIQMIFQNPYASLNPRMTIGNIVADPLRVHGIGSERERRGRVREVLGLVGLDASLVNRYPHQFSGGQRQRVGIARALAVDPALVICDEPVSALDVSIQAQILNLLRDVQERLGLTYLLISHDLAVVRHVADHVAVMYLGRLMEVAGREALYAQPWHPYTQALLRAVHIPDPARERTRRAALLAGEIPSPSDPPPGCTFHTRCPLRARLGNPTECVTDVPTLREVAPGRAAARHFVEPGPRSTREPATAAAAGDVHPAPVRDPS